MAENTQTDASQAEVEPSRWKRLKNNHPRTVKVAAGIAAVVTAGGALVVLASRKSDDLDSTLSAPDALDALEPVTKTD